MDGQIDVENLTPKCPFFLHTTTPIFHRIFTYNFYVRQKNYQFLNADSRTVSVERTWPCSYSERDEYERKLKFSI